MGRDAPAAGPNPGRTLGDPQPPDRMPAAGAQGWRGERACGRDSPKRHELDAAVPAGSEVLVGRILAPADDVLEAFLRHTPKLERG